MPSRSANGTRPSERLSARRVKPDFQSESGFASHPQSASPGLAKPSEPVDFREALGVAQYIADMIPQLEAMAMRSGLDLVGYFLGMVRVEADRYLQTNVSAEGQSKAPGKPSADGSFSEDG